MKKAIGSWLAVILCWSFLAAAQIPVPPLTARVTDQTGTLTAEQTAALEKMLQTFEARKGSQVAVLMVPSSRPEAIEQYALRVAEQWKVGRQKVDDGAILVIAKNDRELRIEVGYGLEGALTDATSRRIISEVIVPRFREGDFYGGINAGVDRLIRVIDGEPLPEPEKRAPAGAAPGIGQYLPILFIAALVLGGVLRSALGRFLGSAATGGAVGFMAWLFAGAAIAAVAAGVIAFVFTLLGGGMGGVGGLGGRGYRGGWGGGGFRGGGGGFGGGGFRGGGGGFGGGGASGRW
jgi:uncharacterized protein